MRKFVCELCGYEYDAAVGDEVAGIEPGTDFEDLPGDWVCPMCGAGKDDFECVGSNEESDDATESDRAAVSEILDRDITVES